LHASSADVKRIDRVRELLGQAGADALLISGATDLRWLTGFTGSSGIAAVLEDRAYFLTDGRYDIQARAEVHDFDITVTPLRGVEALGAVDVLSSAQRVIIQADALTVTQYRLAEAKWPHVEWLETTDVFASLRARKSRAEVDYIVTAQRVAEHVFTKLLKLIKVGTTEREIASFIAARGRDSGLDGMAFEPIVAGGPNAALPHARPSDRPFESGDLIVLDFGYRVNGYCSDMTRTLALGEPGAEARAAYETVLEAKNAAAAAVCEGVPSSDIDGAARSVIGASGLGAAFTHSTGHGVGLDVHEWPRISERSTDLLPPNCVVTVEPGVYLEGRFGIRIEDMILVEGSVPVNLTEAESDLIVL
jgi:Xaa-Pro aminopeptidase